MARWEFMESQEVVGASVSVISFTGLDGDADEEYMLRYQIVHGAPANLRSLQLRPQGAVTGCESRVNWSGSNTNFASTCVLSYCRHGPMIGWAVMRAATNPGGSAVARERSMYGLGYGVQGGAPFYGTLMQGAGVWDDDSTPMTRLDFCSGSGTGTTLSAIMAAGSVVALYRRAA